MPKRYAFFISPHGFGHATRAIALMQAIEQRFPAVVFEIFTTVPDWLFSQSLCSSFNYHPIATDVGLVQRDAFQEDLPATLQQLSHLYPFNRHMLRTLAASLPACEYVFCDIAPLGIAVAKEKGLPAVLVENFTWDWIYQHYLDRYPEFSSYIQEIQHLYGLADIHIQCSPVCREDSGAYLLTRQPVARLFRHPAESVRRSLGIAASQQLVLVSCGGIAADIDWSAILPRLAQTIYVIPSTGQVIRRDKQCIFLPQQSRIYHPDLVRAADAVICKAGYSTIAEAATAGTPIAAVARQSFPETPALLDYVENKLGGMSLTEQAFCQGALKNDLETLLAQDEKRRGMDSGAVEMVDTLW